MTRRPALRRGDLEIIVDPDPDDDDPRHASIMVRSVLDPELHPELFDGLSDHDMLAVWHVAAGRLGRLCAIASPYMNQEAHEHRCRTTTNWGPDYPPSVSGCSIYMYGWGFNDRAPPEATFTIRNEHLERWRILIPSWVSDIAKTDAYLIAVSTPPQAQPRRRAPPTAVHGARRAPTSQSSETRR
jgi:hypothetical protein